MVETPRVSSPFGKYLAGRQAQIDNDASAAAAYYREALALDPNDVMLTRRSYFYLLAAGDAKRALPLARAAAALSPETATLAPLIVAADNARKGRWKDASAMATQASTSGLNQLLTPLIRAWCLQAMGRTDDALEAIKPMEHVRPLAPIHDFHKALILDLAGRTAAADAAYRTAVKRNIGSVRGIEAYANFLARNGREAKAKALYDSYRENHPQTALVETSHALHRAGLKAASRPTADALAGLAEAFYSAATAMAGNQAYDTALGPRPRRADGAPRVSIRPPDAERGCCTNRAATPMWPRPLTRSPPPRRFTAWLGRVWPTSKSGWAPSRTPAPF
nr:hypothetical protein [uncultured Brevundimonas sp.]